MNKKLIIFLLIVWSFSVHAGGLNRCANMANQMALNQCAANILKQDNDKIGRVYQVYMNKLNSTNQAKLKDAQIQWIKFKEKDCAFEASSVKGGSMYPYVLSSCLVDRTEKRISELQNMSDCRNGTEPSCL